MDQNKLQKLRDIEYVVHRTCGSCLWASEFKGDFGTCQLYTYRHAKHFDSTRRLSVHRYGFCDGHDVDPAFQARIHGFAELMEP